MSSTDTTAALNETSKALTANKELAARTLQELLVLQERIKKCIKRSNATIRMQTPQ